MLIFVGGFAAWAECDSSVLDYCDSMLVDPQWEFVVNQFDVCRVMRQRQ
jgi:hypothetical protein